MGSSLSSLRAAAAGAVLATSLAFAVVLSLGERYLLDRSEPVWMLASWLTAGLALLAVLRRAIPRGPAELSGPLCWIAGLLGAAIFGRHALESLSIAAAELPISMSVLGPFDLGDLILWCLMLLAVEAGGGRRSNRSPGIRLGIALLVLLLPTLALLVLQVDSARMSFAQLDPWRACGDCGDRLPGLAGISLALAWTLALVDCAKERAAGRLGIATWLPPIFGCLLLIVLPWWLMSGHAGSALYRVEGSFFARPAGYVFGLYGVRVGAGMETLVSLGGILGLLVFSARWPLMTKLLGAWERFVAVSLSALAAALLPLTSLLTLAALVGWLAVVVGLPPRQDAS